jgi:hypothetical protein
MAQLNYENIILWFIQGLSIEFKTVFFTTNIISRPGISFNRIYKNQKIVTLIQ